MSNEIKIRVGTKLSEAERKAVDPKEVGWSQAQPPKADLQGQMYTCGCSHCPHCGCFNWDSSPTPYGYIICHCCGGLYKA